MQCAIRKGHPLGGQLCSKEQRICSLARSMEVGEWLCADSGLVHSLVEVNANHVGRGRGNATPALPHFAVKLVAAGAANHDGHMSHVLAGAVKAVFDGEPGAELSAVLPD
jgi:hypothetical protein